MSDLPDFRSDDPDQTYQAAILLYQDYLANYIGDEEKAKLVFFACERAMAALMKDMESLIGLTSDETDSLEKVSSLISHNANLNMRLAILGIKINLLVDFSSTFKDRP
ncbi:MAG: hypothetical protein OXE05_07040 [Chloroflexi bacterium]|nr:hypothetical protein [Chloroflexota bacterium]